MTHSLAYISFFTTHVRILQWTTDIQKSGVLSFGHINRVCGEMLGNLLGRIGNLLADDSFQSHEASQLSLGGVSIDNVELLSLKGVTKEGLTDGEKRKGAFIKCSS